MADTILSLDLGMRTGFAFGEVGCACPESGAVSFRPHGVSRGMAFFNAFSWLNAKISGYRPTLIVKEDALPIGALANKREKPISSQASVETTYFLHGAAEAAAAAHGIPVKSGHAATVRKAFIGRGRLGDRDATKEAVAARCVLLKWLPRGCEDYDRADGLALWEWARGAFFSRASALYLYGEEAQAS